jgi:hypothetical protein
MHQGFPQGTPGRLLYDFPLQHTRPDQGVITSGTIVEHQRQVGPWYGGTIPFDELMTVMFAGPTYLEVHTDSVPAGAFRTSLGRPRFLGLAEDPTEWHRYYCS